MTEPVYSPAPIETMVRTRPIVTEEPRLEIWRLLRLFLDEDATVARIRSVHNIANGEQQRNIRKQATQIAQTIRQAEEYFSAARNIGLPTRPTLLYYGGMALARALTLLKLSGDYSYDALRRAQRHQHHGLNLRLSFLNLDPKRVGAEDWFRGIAASVEFLGGDGPAWGTFGLFYEALIAPGVVIRQKVTEAGKPTSLEQDRVLGSAEIQPIGQLRGRTIDSFSILQDLPELWVQLVELGIAPGVCPGELTMETLAGPGAEGERTINNTVDMFVNGSRAQLDKIRDLLRVRMGAEALSESATNLAMRLMYSDVEGTTPAAMYMPDLVESVTGRTFYIVDPDAYLTEPAAHLFLLFCFGMLSRYYPDVWMTVIDKRPLIAELTSSTLDVIERKFPNLVLDQLTGVKHYVQLQ